MFVKIERLLQIFSRRIPFFRAISNENSEIHDGSKYERRVQWAVAIFLALIAGYLDGYGLLVLGTSVSFMSGNTTTTGLKIWTREFPCGSSICHSRSVFRHG
jgi:hypothetical protein